MRAVRRFSSGFSVAMTTNGVLLDRLAGPLVEAGLQRLNVSLDSLNQMICACVKCPLGQSRTKFVRPQRQERNADGFKGCHEGASDLRRQTSDV